MKFLTTVFMLMFLSVNVFAGIDTYNGTTHLGVVSTVQCSNGITCAKTLKGISLGVTNAGITTKKNFATWEPGVLTNGTSTTPSATSVYVASITINSISVLTGIKIANAATVGTNKYVVALFNSAGTKVATSALAGVLTAGASAYQAIPFTATYTPPTTGTYWIGVYVNGTTDRFYSIALAGEYRGPAAAITGQTFGTVANITPPTTFTADVGPVAFTY